MGDHDYRHVAVSELESAPNPTTAKREVDEAVGASEFGFNVYVVAPGEQIPWGYHRHPEHEELFYVVAGRITVETADGEYDVHADEAFFVPKDAPVKAVGAGDGESRVIAVGAPKDADGAILEEECPNCGAVTDRTSERENGEVVLSCAECGTETNRF